MAVNIDRDYYKITDAAKILGCDVSDLQHLGATDKLSFYLMLINEDIEVGMNAYMGEDPRGVPIKIEYKETHIRYTGLALLHSDALKALETNSDYSVSFAYDLLDEADDVKRFMNFYLDMFDAHFDFSYYFTNGTIHFHYTNLFILNIDLERLKKRYPNNFLDAVTKPAAKKPINDKATHAHVSDNLATLNQASTRFWANADPNDSATHPLNSAVAAWLIERSFTQTLADKGATIIRPTWATTGRKADK
jgi:hypothetical protein